jgi:hypothetical protein
MSKDTARIAVLLGISESEAREFCLEIQSKFKGAIPRFRDIRNCLEKKAKATPEEIARMIEHSSPRFRLGPRSRKLSLTPISYEPDYPADSSGFFKKKIRKRGRVALEDAEKCPHGVPKAMKCAICDPKGFKEQTGL